MTKYEGTVAAQRQALSVRFNAGETSLASWADLFLTCGSKRTFSVVLLSSLPRKLGYPATADNERQLSCRNKSAHSSVPCHVGGLLRGDVVVCLQAGAIRREAWRQLPPSVNNKSKQTYLPLQVQDKYRRRRHAWRWRGENPSDEARERIFFYYYYLGLRKNMGHSSELILAPIILLPLHSFTLLKPSR